MARHLLPLVGGSAFGSGHGGKEPGRRPRLPAQAHVLNRAPAAGRTLRTSGKTQDGRCSGCAGGAGSTRCR